MTNGSFASLLRNDRFIGDLVEGLLRLPAGVKTRAVEYQALRLLAHENGIQLDGRVIIPRAELVASLAEKGIGEDALPAAVKRISTISMPNAVPRIGNIFTSENADLLPGKRFAVKQAAMDDLALAQAAGRLLAITGIAPKFAARFDPEIDPKEVVALQTTLNALRENTSLITPDTVTQAANLLVGAAQRLGSKAQRKVATFMQGLPAISTNVAARPSGDAVPSAVNRGPPVS